MIKMNSHTVDGSAAEGREPGGERDGAEKASDRQGRSFDWSRVWSACERRLRSWRVPPRWSLREWMEEMQAEGAMAVLLALRDYQPERNVPLVVYVRMRIMARILTRYREEWAYSLRHVSVDQVDVSAAADQAGMESPTSLHSEVTRALELLSDADRRLIERLFWQGETEARVASVMGLTQQAISKKKLSICNVMSKIIDKD